MILLLLGTMFDHDKRRYNSYFFESGDNVFRGVDTVGDTHHWTGIGGGSKAPIDYPSVIFRNDNDQIEIIPNKPVIKILLSSLKVYIEDIKQKIANQEDAKPLAKELLELYDLRDYYQRLYKS